MIWVMRSRLPGSMPLVRLTTGIHGRIHLLGVLDRGPEALGRHAEDQHVGVPDGLLEVGGRPQPPGEGDAGR